MAKSKLRIEARKLRQTGLGIKTIAHQLQVSSSTVSLWCRDIMLTEAQMSELARRSQDPSYGKRLAYTQKLQQARLEKIQRLFIEGVRDVGPITKRELFIAGISIYWAEGFKKDNLVGFANSDPKMILLFIQWLDSIGIRGDRLRFRLTINESYRSDVHKIEAYWRHILQINTVQLQKPFFQQVKWKKLYENPYEYHGVIRVRVTKSTDLLRKLKGWIEGLANARV